MNQNLAKVSGNNSPVARLKNILNSDSVQQQFKNALKENTSLFCASLIDLYANDSYLQNCDPKDVVMEALKAATLKLPINKSLGFAYLVPYKNNKTKKLIPTFIIGYKGYLQLAQRTAQYKYINADCIYEGERVEQNRITGEVMIYGEPTSDKAVGYFAYIETVTGFKKCVVWTKKQVEDHAKQYSQSYYSDYSPWKKQFDTMAIKTAIRHLINRYGVMSVDMVRAIDYDSADYLSDDQEQNKLPQSNVTGVSYEPTASPPAEPETPKPEAPQETPQEQAPGGENNAFSKDEGINTGQELSAEVDDLGIPVNSPMAKKNWFFTRAGKDDKTTGFAKFITDNAQYLSHVTDQGWAVMVDKWANFYNEDFPYDRHGNEIGPDSEIANDISEEKEDVQAILETPAAKQLAEIAKKHPAEYKQVVDGQQPESIEQIITWMEQINTMVVNARINKDQF